MRQHDNRYVKKLDAIPQTFAGQTFTVEGENLCPAFSPVTGRPLQIERIELICTIGTASIAGTGVSGEDVVRVARAVSLVQRDGMYRYRLLDGQHLRAIAVLSAGIDQVEEHADWATGSIAAKRVVIPLWMSTPKAYAPRDTVLMAAAIEKLTWTGVTTDAGGPCIAGGTMTFTSASWEVRVIAREVPYMINGPVPCWELSQFVSGESVRPLRFGGKVPFGLILHKDGADGGASLSSLTSIYIDEYGSQHTFTPTDLREIYAVERKLARGWAATTGAVITYDPFAQGVMLPLMFPTDDARSKPSLNRPNLTLHAVPVLAGLTAIVCGLAPRNPKLRPFLVEAYAPAGQYDKPKDNPRATAPKKTHGAWRLKTEDNTQRGMVGRPSEFIAEKANLHDYTGGE